LVKEEGDFIAKSGHVRTNPNNFVSPCRGERKCKKKAQKSEDLRGQKDWGALGNRQGNKDDKKANKSFANLSEKNAENNKD